MLGLESDIISSRQPLLLEKALTSERDLVWEHRAVMPLPAQISHEDGTVVEVRLSGSLNKDFSELERGWLLREAWRVLEPGGRLIVVGIVSDRLLTGESASLPGRVLVRRVPAVGELLGEIRDAGFEGVKVANSSPAFQHGTAELQEKTLEAWKPKRCEDVVEPTRFGG